MKNNLVPYVRVPTFYAGATECTNRHCKQEFPRVRLLQQGHVALCLECWDSVPVYMRMTAIQHDSARVEDINLSTCAWLTMMMQCIDEAEDASERRNPTLVRTDKRSLTTYRRTVVVDAERETGVFTPTSDGIAPHVENTGP